MNFIGKRLKIARKIKGFSQEKLSQKLNKEVSKQSISKYERGLMNPGSSIVNKLAEVLDVKIDYFFRPFKNELKSLNFRKKTKLSKKNEDKIKFEVLDKLERYIELEEIVGSKKDFKNPFENNVIKNKEEAERYAEKLRKKWEFGLQNPLLNLSELLEEKGIHIIEVEVDENFDGLSSFSNGNYFIVINKNFDNVRKRFTLSHELAHLLFEFENKEEKLCNQFSGAFLLPQKIIFTEFGRKRTSISLRELITIKENYGISLQGVVERLYNLEIISKTSRKNFYIYLNKKGWKKNEPGVYSSIEYSERFEQLLNKALALNLISLSKAAALANKSIYQIREDFVCPI
ncbi:MAG: helix-turn-helix domain-containing protein [Candidatus Mcinerneyibacterium aminivorans]|uniref:Helix-turn-helix domain-containing protein n=1 Tax=Candidatus Mcinerneyibacterium aminivorans TaxID=2703815 RepID=A0A5D0MAE6_9BACT|nr:MAG: helix-turn-helix domain-containing protein [Candidatus Mcinerneyibacterium aminivorans]